MKKAQYHEKNLVVDILCRSFEANQSVNYIVKQDNRRSKRIRSLVEYSFAVCYRFGDVFLSDDNEACALILYTDKKKNTILSVLLDLKLIFTCVGIGNIRKTLARESIIKRIKPSVPMHYLWFIGVNPQMQNKGIGSLLLRSVLEDSEKKGKPVYLETSTLKNLPWYKRFGFEIYNVCDLDYRLYFLRRILESQ